MSKVLVKRVNEKNGEIDYSSLKESGKIGSDKT